MYLFTVENSNLRYKINNFLSNRSTNFLFNSSKKETNVTDSRRPTSTLVLDIAPN